ncbi:Trafficking protein particle complex subunit [Lachnellula hyalina]|uniref:Trafficking protein particle complex subunit n=1 Tax=Lachnellula hyalina TaxID=1316788 RepID=A0A8H8U3Q6_9HELO|nr:Trafficking protein particle complex subunit [Lachnellula hyalina]TVY30537.1 Trafficking protein particle complex subunit [Lachnellula hyalina]
MAHQRVPSTIDAVKEPHSVSLKVLRLSRPSLSIQHPLPPSPSPSPSPDLTASLAYPSTKPDAFILSPLLTLPPAFGSAYVGETFSCTLCANNEILPGSTPQKTISNVRIEAEMKIPSSATPTSLPLSPPSSSSSSSSSDENEKDAGVDLEASKSLQKIVNFDLKEEGSHVLAVTVTYTETTPTSGRIRTFRKLYQFVCKGCMVVRTKAGPLPPSPSSSSLRKWALEAQLENCGEDTICLDGVVLETRDGLRSVGLNGEERPVLMPGDVRQVCFLVEEVDGGGTEEGGEDHVWGAEYWVERDNGE